jgi:hypothetical protein
MRDFGLTGFDGTYSDVFNKGCAERVWWLTVSNTTRILPSVLLPAHQGGGVIVSLKCATLATLTTLILIIY